VTACGKRRGGSDGFGRVKLSGVNPVMGVWARGEVMKGGVEEHFSVAAGTQRYAVRAFCLSQPVIYTERGREEGEGGGGGTGTGVSSLGSEARVMGRGLRLTALRKSQVVGERGEKGGGEGRNISAFTCQEGGPGEGGRWKERKGKGRGGGGG